MFKLRAFSKIAMLFNQYSGFTNLLQLRALGLILFVPVFAQNQVQNQISVEMIENLANFEQDGLGNPQIKSKSITPAYSESGKLHHMLIIPVQHATIKQRFLRSNQAG